MDLDFYNSELCLAENAPIGLKSAQGVRITCTAGVVWLTIAGEARDIFLARGESHLLDAPGLALLEAIGNGQVRFEKAGQPLWCSLLAGGQGCLRRLRALRSLVRLATSRGRVRALAVN